MTTPFKSPPLPVFRSLRLLYHERRSKLIGLFDDQRLVPSAIRDSTLAKVARGEIVKKGSFGENSISVLHRPVIDSREPAIGSVQEGILEDVFNRWNLMLGRDIKFLPELREPPENLEFEIDRETKFGTLIERTQTVPEFDPSMCYTYFKRLYLMGLIRPAKRKLLWSYLAQRWYRPDEARLIVTDSSPVIVQINRSMRMPVGVRYTIDIDVPALGIRTPVSFTRIDRLWSARSLYITVDKLDKDRIKVQPNLVAHPLNPGKRIPVIIEEADEISARFLSPSQSMEDYEICMRHGNININWRTVFNSHGKYSGTEQQYKNLNRMQLAEKTLEILEGNEDFNLRTESIRETVLVCPETYDLLDEYECNTWEISLTELKLSGERIHPYWSALASSAPTPVDSLIVGYERYRSTPQRNPGTYPLPLWRQWNVRDRLATSEWLYAESEEHLQEQVKRESGDAVGLDALAASAQTKFVRTSAIFSPQFMKIVPWLENKVTLDYHACTWSRLKTEILPAIYINHKLGNPTPVIRDILALPKIDTVEVGNVVAPKRDIRQSLVRFGEDSFRIALLAGLPTVDPRLAIRHHQVVSAGLRLALHWRLFKYYNHWIGKYRPATSVYEVDFSAFNLLPHDQYFLTELQKLIDQVNIHMTKYRAGRALELILDFIEHRFYREYLQLTRSEILQLVVRERITFNEQLAKFKFYSDARGEEIAWVLLKGLDLINHLLHPFCPYITDHINATLHPAKLRKPTLDFYPHTFIASSHTDSEADYPILVDMGEVDIRYQNPEVGKPVINDTGYFAPHVREFVQDAYKIMKGLQYLRFRGIQEKSLDKDTDGSASWITSNQKVGDIYPDFHFQDKLLEEESQAWGAVYTSKLGMHKYARWMSIYKNRIAGSASITILDFYAEPPPSGQFDRELKLADDIVVYLRLAPEKRESDWVNTQYEPTDGQFKNMYLNEDEEQDRILDPRL